MKGFFNPSRYVRSFLLLVRSDARNAPFVANVGAPIVASDRYNYKEWRMFCTETCSMFRSAMFSELRVGQHRPPFGGPAEDAKLCRHLNHLNPPGVPVE